ncbi:MAG: hypothetical protein H7X74_07660 [Methyloceanibacter sp.]|nr:hypothetical protein [Methyloceanibacter sp.]
MDRAMRGLAVVLLLFFWSSPALPQVNQGEAVRYAQHGNSDQSDSEGGGHAIHSGPIAPEEEASGSQSQSESSQCADVAGSAGALGYYACRARTALFGSVERAILTFTALLALSTLLLWVYTRRAANAARVAAEHIPAVERAYVFGGPTDLFLLHDQASVRLAMQNYGRTPAVIRGWLVEFLAQEPRGGKPAYDEAKRTAINEILEPDKLFSPPVVFRSEISAPFFIVGYIIYDDVFRQSHTTRFCVGVARDGKAVYAGHPAWNEYN